MRGREDLIRMGSDTRTQHHHHYRHYLHLYIKFKEFPCLPSLVTTTSQTCTRRRRLQQTEVNGDLIAWSVWKFNNGSKPGTRPSRKRCLKWDAQHYAFQVEWTHSVCHVMSPLRRAISEMTINNSNNYSSCWQQTINTLATICAVHITNNTTFSNSTNSFDSNSLSLSPRVTCS